MRNLLLVLSVVVLAACGVKDPKNPKFIVAEGKGVKVTRGDLNTKIGQFLARKNFTADQLPLEQLAELERRVLEQDVQQELLISQALAEGLKPETEKAAQQVKAIKGQAGTPEKYGEFLKSMGVTEAQLLENIGKFAMIDELIKKKVAVVADPKIEDVENFYKNNPGTFEQPEQVRASHVLIKVDAKADAAVKAQKRKLIDAARARVMKGEDFAKVALEVSEDPGSAKEGGDLKYFRHGEMVPEFDKAAFTSKVGTVTPVIETAFGYHFLKVTDHKEAHTQSLDEARGPILNYMKNQAQQRAVKDYLASIMTNAKVVYHLPEPPKKEALPLDKNIKVPAPAASAPAAPDKK
jgi:peptidyl-prolyl cis-trans isomerase C